MLDGPLRRVDRWQRAHTVPAVGFAVIRKFGDDGANQYVIGLGWYAFVAIYPLLLLVITVFGFVGAASLGHRLVATLHQFPVVGEQFNPAHGSSRLHGSILGLVIGLAGLLYGAQGVTQTAERAMVRIWDIPKAEVPGFLPRLARSVAGLVTIGAAFVGNAVAATFATSGGLGPFVRVGVVVAMVVMNLALYLITFRILTPLSMGTGVMVPGAAVAGLGFTFLITLGSGLVEHQIRNSSATYGQFGIVIGLVGFLFLVAKISLYGAELNPVLLWHVWPRAMRDSDPTSADDRVRRTITTADGRPAGDPVEPDGLVPESSQVPRPPDAAGDTSCSGPIEVRGRGRSTRS